jgi:hypothetical protein
MGRLLWLPEQLRRWGVPHVIVPGWEQRGAPVMFPECVVTHHDALPSSATALQALQLMIQGRPDLPGPLCQLWIDDDHDLTEFKGDPIVFVVASGRANHAGPGGWFGVSGNSRAIGIEARNRGTGEPWSPLMQAVYWRTCAALLERIGRHHGWVCAHREWAPRRKIDPAGLDPNEFRQHVADLLAFGPPVTA